MPRRQSFRGATAGRTRPSPPPHLHSREHVPFRRRLETRALRTKTNSSRPVTATVASQPVRGGWRIERSELNLESLRRKATARARYTRKTALSTVQRRERARCLRVHSRRRHKHG